MTKVAKVSFEKGDSSYVQCSKLRILCKLQYDDDYECYTCEVNLDEDEMVKFITGNFHQCPYFKMGDEYRIVRKQM